LSGESRAPGESGAFLELRALGKRFGEHTVLDEVSLEIAEGEILALLGPSGSGKTTILRLLAGFERAERGEILLTGRDVTSLSPGRRGFGMVFQHYALFPHMTVAENIAFGLESQGRRKPEIEARIAEMLELVDLPGLGARRVSEISGGQQQRVALARALAPEPRLLLLDEPLSNLDPALRERTRRELREAVRRVGITTVLVTHEQEEAFTIGDRVAVLNRGRLEQVGHPEELYGEPRSRFVATFVGRASALPARLESVDGNLAWARLGGLAESGSVSWSAHADGAFEPGAAVDLVVRPESLRLVADDTPGAVASRALVRRFTGPLTYLVVRLSNGVEAEVKLEPAAPWQPGDEVWIAPDENGPPPRLFPRSEPAT